MKQRITDQIRLLLIRGLPYVSNNIGTTYEAASFSVVGNQVKLQFNQTIDTVDKIYVVHNIKIKNYIESFVIDNYAIEMVLKQKPKVFAGDIITLKGFIDPIYNTQYEIDSCLKENGKFKLILKIPNGIQNDPDQSQLGYLPTEYNAGFNGVKSFTFNSPDYVYSFDAASVLCADIDTDFMPKIIDANDQIVCWDKKFFLESENTLTGKDQILIDTSSFTITPSRSTENNTESVYNSYDSKAEFRKDCNLKVYYILQKVSDTLDQQQKSGSDNAFKQLQADIYLTSMLNRRLELDDGLVSGSVVPSSSSIDTSVETRVSFEFDLSFFIQYKSRVIFDFDEVGTYQINTIKAGTNIITVR